MCVGPTRSSRRQASGLHEADRQQRRDDFLPVNDGDGHQGGSNIDGTHDAGGEQGIASGLASSLKHLGRVEHDGVDAGKLLEARQEEGLRKGGEGKGGWYEKRESAVATKDCHL